jgi:hypothetical protein
MRSDEVLSCSITHILAFMCGNLEILRAFLQMYGIINKKLKGDSKNACDTVMPCSDGFMNAGT